MLHLYVVMSKSAFKPLVVCGVGEVFGSEKEKEETPVSKAIHLPQMYTKQKQAKLFGTEL